MTVHEAIERYRSTPRVMDERLTAVLRNHEGVEGCLFNLAGLAGLALMAVAALATLLSHRGWTCFGFVAAFVSLSLLALRRGSRQRAEARRRALETALVHGPLMLAYVVQAQPGLFAPGDRVLRAVLLYSRDDAHRLDLAYGARALERVRALHDAPDPGELLRPVWNFVQVDGTLGRVKLERPAAEDDATWVEAAMANPDFLPDRRLPEDGVLVCVWSDLRDALVVIGP